MPPSQFDTSWDDLKNLPIIFPSVTQQNEILNKSKILGRIKIVENNLKMLTHSYDELGRSLVTTTVTEGLRAEAKRGDF
jgi:hypothetical protein